MQKRCYNQMKFKHKFSKKQDKNYLYDNAKLMKIDVPFYNCVFTQGFNIHFVHKRIYFEIEIASRFFA